MANQVVPPLYFGHLSYTPPPGYSGHFPGVRDEIPGLAYSDTRRNARKDAIWANVDRPQIWKPFISKQFSEKGRSRDPSRALTDPMRAIIPEQHSPRNTSLENLDGNIHKPISSANGLVPGYAGFIPHIRSNAIPGFNFKRLTRNKGETARLNRDSITYITESRQAYEEAAAAILQDQENAGPIDSSGPTFYPDSTKLLPDRHPAAFEEARRDFSVRFEMSEEEFLHCNSVWLDLHSKLEEHFRLPSASFRRMDEARKGYIDPSDVRKMMNLLSIEASDKIFTCIVQALGCNSEGKISVVDFMRAADLSFAEALMPRENPAIPSTARSSTRGKPRFMQPTSSNQELNISEKSWGSEEGPLASDSKFPTIVIRPKTDPTMGFALQTARDLRRPPPPSVLRQKEMELKNGKAYGQPAITGYQGHVGLRWRNKDGEQMQNQLLLRVKPALRAKPARLRTNTEEADENSSDALKEAKAAWALILSNFAEFRKVQKAFRMVDKDFSGIISREELRHLIQNVLYIAVSDPAFDIIFNTMDTDHSGELTFDEFAAAISDENIRLTEAVSDTAEAQTGLARQAMYEEMIKKNESAKHFDIGPSRDLDSRYERLRIGDKAWNIQNLRRIIEKRFFEIRNSFVSKDPEGKGGVSREEFVLLLRRNHIAPDGGDAALNDLIKTLDPEGTGIVDYLAMLRAFESVDPSLRMADEKVAVKAAVERRLHAQEGAGQGSGGGEEDSGTGDSEVTEAAFKKKRLDDQSMSYDRSKEWQQPERPGCPTAETRRDYQRRARQLGLTVAGDLQNASPVRSSAPIFPIRRRGTVGGRGGEGDNGAPGHSKVLYGVDLGASRHRPTGKDGEAGEQRENMLEGFSNVAIQSAREAWDLVRMASESSFGSAQKAFRSVDKDASGRIELGELRHLLMVNLNIDLEEEAIAVIFKCLDRGNKGNITYTEFIAGLRAPLQSSGDGDATALELEQHPLDPAYGKRLAGQQPPTLHAASYDKTLSRATRAGNVVLGKGPSKVQYGDRYAWKAAQPYSSTSRETISIPAAARLPPASDVAGISSGPFNSGPMSLDKVARRAGVQFVDVSAEFPPSPLAEGGVPGSSGGYSPPSTGRRAGTPPPPPSPVHSKKQYSAAAKDEHGWSPAQAKEVSKIYFAKGN